MPVVKQPINIPFGQGIETKTDPFQVRPGKYLSLKNSVFNSDGLLQKRNGFGQVTVLPDTGSTTLTTFRDGLVATGAELFSYSTPTNTWTDKGKVQPVDLSVKSLIKTSLQQDQVDSATAPNGAVCIAFMENSIAYYQVNDSLSGQTIVSRVTLPNTALNPRVFLLGPWFIVTFITSNTLAYYAIPYSNPSAPLTSNTPIATNISSSAPMYDCTVLGDSIYIAYNGSDLGGAVHVLFMTKTFIQGGSTDYVNTATKITMASDATNSRVWLVFQNLGTTTSYVAVYDSLMNPILAPTAFAFTSASTGSGTNLASTVLNGKLMLFADKHASSAAVGTVSRCLIDTAGTVTGSELVCNRTCLASKAFTLEGQTYVWILSNSVNLYQPTYFLVDGDTNILCKMAYSNARTIINSGYLPSVSNNSNIFTMSALVKDLIAPMNKAQGGIVTGGTQIGGIYSQLGVNLASFTINNNSQTSAELAGSLQLSGGQVWEYDGTTPVELGFHLWPEDITFTTSTAGGNMIAQQYFYQITYEWTDAAGNIHRSAPSVPLSVDLSGTGSNINTVTLSIPVPGITAKTNVRVGVYRWGTNQQVYYMLDSPASMPKIATPKTTSGPVVVVDTHNSQEIQGNTILYTNGGVLENIAPPAAADLVLFKNRMWVLDAEDRNLWWFSKPVVEGTPVEMTDLQTYYVAPTASSNQSTGELTAGASMDDKFIHFKENAILYTTGTGPDITGANNDFSDPIFVTSTVGCTNIRSIVLTPVGLMFQSNKGIWLLARDLSTKYIGASVQGFNDIPIVGAVLVPGTNQVRFNLEDGQVLMYDYYQDQWGEFSNIPGISSTIWRGLHAFLDQYGRVLQETPGLYLDGSKPVLLSFRSAWMSFAGVQGFERFYELYLLGKYYTPFKLNVSLAYDYNESSSHSVAITPDNFSPPWGGEAVWGSGGVWGGPTNAFSNRVFPKRQKCETFQIVIEEIYDPSFGIAAGQGLSLSQMTLVVGTKKGYRTQKGSQSFG